MLKEWRLTSPKLSYTHILTEFKLALEFNEMFFCPAPWASAPPGL